MELPERRAASPQDEDVSHSARQTCINQLGAQRQPELQQPETSSLQLDFQDSNMSPALSLFPGMAHNITEFSFLQQSETEFAPLRAYPDISMASERFPAHNYTTNSSQHASLSQHPLAQADILSEEGESSCCSLSQHSLSPEEQSKRGEKVHPPVIVGSREKDPETLTNPAAKLVGAPAEDETFFLSRDIPAQQLLELLQKDVGMLSSSNSAVSSASETSVKRTESSKSSEVGKLITQSTDIREGPPDEAAFPQQQTQQHDRFSDLDQPQTVWEPAVSNITMGSRSTQPDESSEMLHRELLSEVERCTRIEAESKNKQQKGPTPPGQSLTPHLKEMPEAKLSVSRKNVVGMQWTGSFSAGVERVYREQDLWSSGNQIEIDGSYLGFVPQSQSTPGVFNAPTKISVQAKLGHLSSIESNKENSYQSVAEISLQPVVPIVDAHNPDIATEYQEDNTSAKVQSLPSLNYMQKVDAWRANQSSGNMSLFDSLALQGFSGIPPKQKAYDAVSDSLNRLVSQKVRSLQQPLVSGAATQTSSTTPSGTSSPRRMEAVGSAPTDENTGSAVPPSASPLGRSQSHSSLSTVVMSVQKDQQIDWPPEKEKNKSQDDHDQTITVETSHLTSLGHFSDVSLDQDLTLSSSQDSYSGIKLGPSTGTSSVVSLEIDNYVPSWTSKLLTPPPFPKPREFNIDERIPLYLRNLGIDQSPSTILTPFAPRGPIREPEFSPTEFCTIKGSSGTPTKSTQPSEGGSPHKDEFSRSSILSVDSSISVPFSLDSLGPAASIPEQTRWTSSPSDAESSQNKHKLAPYSSPDENTHSSTLQSFQQQKDGTLSSSRNISQLEHKYNSNVSSAIKERHRERNLESLLQTSHNTDQSTEDSFVSSKALLEIRKLVSHVETVISTGSSVASSTSSIAPHLFSDQDILLSLKKKTSRLQDFSSSSCTAGDPRTHSSLLWARSSSDSMLTSEKMRQSSIGLEGVNRSLQLDYPSTQALFTAQTKVASKAPQDSTVSDIGTSLVLSKSTLRTEPEGCSAAPPDKAPTQLAVIKPPTAVRTAELSSAPADSVDVPMEEEITHSEGSAQSRSSSPILKDTDQGVMSDGSSESSLTARVAKLLQSDSPSTMVSSTPSITDQEESKAREWIKLKLLGQQCEPLQLDEEDRRRIEEIKRELLLKNPIKSQFSTDTESSAASSVKILRELDPPQPAETFAAPNDAVNQLTQLLQSLSRTTPGSSIQQQMTLQSDLEARVCEIAAREGVTLPTKKPQAFTSITIATRRRSTSPSPFTSPAPPVSPVSEPLHLTELSKEAVKTTTADRKLSSKLNEEHRAALVQTTTKEPPSVYGPSSSLQNRNQNVTTQSAPGNQKRQDTVGGQFEEPLQPSQVLHREDVTVRDNNTQLIRPDYKLSASGVGRGSDQATASTTVEASVQTGHVSHVHLTLSPKATDHIITSVVCSSHVDVMSGLPRKEFVPLRHSSSAVSSPDEGVGLSSPLEWCNTREPLRQWPPETVVPQGRMTTTSTQSFTPCDRSEISPRPFITETPVPVLLPYKPRGSEEVFYVPQTEFDVSSIEMSDTTMESTHTGSDDAVPPSFSSDILGHKDPGLDRGVTIRHTEGIYSKRLKTANFTMQENGQRDASVTADKSLQIVRERPKPPSQVSFAFTREPLLVNQETFKRDQGTSPIQFLRHDQPESRPERFQPFNSEMYFSKENTHQVQTSEHQIGTEQQRSSDHPLDQLWQRFCDQWSREELHPTSDREASLLERLERLSRLIHSSTRRTNMSQVQEVNTCNPEQKQERRREDVTQRRKEINQTLEEIKRNVQGEVREQEWKVRGQRKTEPPIQLRFRVDDSSQSAEDDSHPSLTSSFSHTSFQNQHPSPTDRDKLETFSTTSGSTSTVDTARLLRVFGPDKVQRLKTTSSLSKLYNIINKQKEERVERTGRSRKPPHIFTVSATTSTDQSVSADSTSPTSTYTSPSHHGPSRTLRAKTAVKLVNKRIQAGDLEIVHNGTRRHTRDVGTTFPSPGGARAFGQISFSSSSVARGGGGGQRSPDKVQGVHKQRRSKKTPPKHYPKGLSWFISADGLGSEARKENQPEEEERPSVAWFEPYSRINPWRQPLRQRQVHEDTNKHHTESDPDPKTMITSSGVAHMSLQEALEMRRPEFISRSRQRVNRLTLQVEERKLQAAFSRERGELFNQPGGFARLPRAAGTALLRRAVPRKEMIQRSKQIYENLPEVQRRREEERRKAEYHTYRLNAQLFNKRITSRVLGRWSAWQ